MAIFDKKPNEDIVKRLKRMRKHYCTGPCGQSSSVLEVRGETKSIIDDAIKEIVNFRESDNCDTHSCIDDIEIPQIMHDFSIKIGFKTINLNSNILPRIGETLIVYYYDYTTTPLSDRNSATLKVVDVIHEIYRDEDISSENNGCESSIELIVEKIV